MRRAFLPILFAFASLGAAPAFDSKPWLEDLHQSQQVLIAKYADLEWAVFEREADLPGLFASAHARIEHAHSEYEARIAFDRLARRLNDEHVGFEWPRAAASDATAKQGSVGPANPCAQYSTNYQAPLLAALAPGYRALGGATEFPSGLIDVAGTRVGVLKIPMFSPKAWPDLCEAAVAELKIGKDQDCDDECSDCIDLQASAYLTRDLIAQVRALQAAGANVLLIDIASNGGGSEWSEAVVRMLTPVRVTSQSMHFARGEHWAKKFADDEAELKAAAQTASPEDRAFLLGLVAEVEAKRQVALTPCDATPLWRGEHPACAPLGVGFYGSGILASADPAKLRGKSWAPTVFSPMEFPYEEGVWRGPLIVLIDRDSASSSSRFASTVQDNRTGIVMGEPATGGSGRTDGGTPTTLNNSKARLLVPDIAMFRLDGTNMARGIEPDVLVGFEPAAGPRLRAARFLAKLPEAVAKAQAQAASR
jgi:hypothetical protein